MIDEDTMPDWMKMKVEESTKKKVADLTPFLLGGNGYKIECVVIRFKPASSCFSW